MADEPTEPGYDPLGVVDKWLPVWDDLKVFLAVHRGLGGYEKQLVIKRVLPKMAADEKFLRLFFDEAKLRPPLPARAGRW